MRIALTLAVAYVLGAISASYIAGRLRGIDLRQHGSRNLGATNVYRVLGWWYAIPVVLFDVGKGLLAVLLGRWIGPPGAGDWFPAAMGAAAVLGHIWSPFVRFRGGKGVATAAGVFIGLAPVAMLIALAVWAVCLRLTGYVSLSSLVAAGTFPVWVRLTTPEATPALYASLGLAAAIVFTHRENIKRLLSGTENRFRARSERTQ